MGLFNEAIQTMSDLAIQESGITVPETAAPAIIDEFKATLDSLPTLNEQDEKFPAILVPIRESKELNTFLIEMEDISRFMISNKIDNIMEALEIICNENNEPDIVHNITLVINEQSILNELSDLGFNIGDPEKQPAGLGKGLIGSHLDIDKFRKFANSKEFLDTVSSRYGIKFAKKNYSVGLVQEETELKPNPGDKVITEKPKTDKTQDNKKSTKTKKQPVTENLSAREKHLQYLRDVASGKFDDDESTIVKEENDMSYINFKNLNESYDDDDFYANYKEESDNDINQALYDDEEDNINPAFYSESGDPSQNYKNAIDIPEYGQDHSVGDGDDPETSKINIPALLAAKTAGGTPHPETLKNGISNRKPLKKFDDFKIKL